MQAVTQNERNLAMACHIGGLVGSFFPPGNFIVPLVIWLLRKDQSPFIDYHGKEALNFQINVSIYTIIGIVLIILLVGIVLLPIIGLLALAFGIVAGVKAYEGQYYRIPYLFRLIK